MSFDLEKILRSKREFRQRLAARPIAEKLALLDDLREREIAIRGHGVRPGAVAGVLRESPPPYAAKLPGVK